MASMNDSVLHYEALLHACAFIEDRLGTCPVGMELADAADFGCDVGCEYNCDDCWRFYFTKKAEEGHVEIRQWH